MSPCRYIAAFSALTFLIGCTPKEEESLVPPAPDGGGGSLAVQGSPETAALPVAPPPTAPSTSAAGGGATPATGTTASTTTAVGYIDGDPLAYYRYDFEARKLDDLGALQNTIDAYGRTVGQTFTSEDAPKPPLTKLEDLVTYRVLRGIPAPPAGKRYVFDAATQKLTLESN